MTLTIENLLELIQQNPDIRNQLAEALNLAPTPISAPPAINPVVHGRPCPDISTLTIAQATFFDNGIHRPKNKTEYAVTFEIWAEDTATLKLNRPTWKKSISLIHYDRFKQRIDGMISGGSISQEFYDKLISAYQHAEPQPNQAETPFFGLVANKTPGVGTAYLDDHFMFALMKNRLPTAVQLLVGDNSLVMDKFATTDLKGNPLKGNAQVQARYDLTGNFHPKWRTN